MSTSAFKAIKPFLVTKSDVSMPFACSNSFVVVKFDKSSTTLTLSLIWLSGSDYNSFMIYSATIPFHKNIYTIFVFQLNL